MVPEEFVGSFPAELAEGSVAMRLPNLKIRLCKGVREGAGSGGILASQAKPAGRQAMQSVTEARPWL